MNAPKAPPHPRRVYKSFALRVALIASLWVLCLGACTQPSLTPCKTNADCQQGQACFLSGCVDESNICPGVCRWDLDCSRCGADLRQCVRGKCQKIECVDDNDCQGRPNGEVKCIGHACTRPGPGQLCGDSSACPSGHICAQDTISGKSFCFQDCTDNPDSCKQNTADGRTTCYRTSSAPGARAICVHLGDSTGVPCGTSTFNSPSVVLCNANRFGKPPLYCSKFKNQCVEAVVVDQEGAPCSSEETRNEAIRLCNSSQPHNLTCSKAGGTSKCAKFKEAGENELCDNDGVYLPQATRCASGLQCVRFYYPYAYGRCHRACQVGGPECASLGDGFTCVPLLSPTRGVCLDNKCTLGLKPLDCTVKGDICAPYETNNPTKTLCYPPNPSGSRLFAQTCGGTDYCDATKGLRCINASLADKGFCTLDCTRTKRCPMFTSRSGKRIAALCVKSSQTSNAMTCVLPCANDSECPQDLRCQSVGSGQICLP